MCRQDITMKECLETSIFHWCFKYAYDHYFMILIISFLGIVLQWNLPPEARHLKIMGFEIFCYQEKNNVPISSALWKKIGSVDPMPLPMSCTLTQFVEGFKYHFSIRAFCKDDNFGHFSDPASIMFMPEISS